MNKNIHDQMYSLRDENIQLKKQMTQSEENTKKLLFKIQKLSEQATRNGTSNPKTKEDRESEDFISELKSHVTNLNHNNTQLKTKMQYFKTLYENESKKRSQYMHIPPRIETGVTRRPTKSRTINKSNVSSPQASDELQKMTETIAELQEINNRYRTKLEAQDLIVNQSKHDSDTLKQLMEQQMKNADIDRIALQHELSEMKRKFLDQRTKLDGVEEHHRLISTAYKDICSTVESLGKDLAEERKKTGDLELQVQKTRIAQESEAELQVIISDLQAEKTLLEVELHNMIDNRFATQRDDEFQAEILSLKQKIQAFEVDLKQSMIDKARMEQELFAASVNLATAQNNSQTQEAKALELQHQLEVLQAKLQHFSKNKESEPSASDMEEAFALLRLKREAGLNFEFLSNWQQMEKDNQIVQELRRQYASCVQELEKTVSMLNLEHKINDEHKVEIAQLKDKIRAIQNEYELRLEEYSRLNDARRHKIEALEQQIRYIANPEIVHEPKSYITRDFTGGDNVLQITIHGAVLSSICSDYICKNLPELGHMENLVSFVCIDFYDFETEISSIGVGMKPIYNHISKFCVTVDDFFLYFLQLGKVLFNFCYSNGVEFYTIGYCAVNLSQLASNDSKPFKYIGDIYAMSSNEVVLGCIEYSVQVAVPIPLAIKAYKERNLSLNLNQHQLKSAHLPKSEMNNLNFSLSAAAVEKVLPNGKIPRIYAVVHFEPVNHGIVTPTISGNYMPHFQFETTIPVYLNLDTDRHLRVGKILVVIADEVEKEWIYGYCKIPLIDLAQGLSINDTFPIESYTGTNCGSLAVKLWWETEYCGLEKPLISLFDDKETKEELLLHTPEPIIKDRRDNLLVKVERIEFDYKNSQVKACLERTKQLFVSVDICGFTDEAMESPPLLLGEDGIVKQIDFQTETLISQLVQKVKAENNGRDSILFSIVDEPPTDSENEDCEDIGTSTILFTDWNLENQLINIPILSKGGDLKLGSLTVKISGLFEFTRTLLK